MRASTGCAVLVLFWGCGAREAPAPAQAEVAPVAADPEDAALENQEAPTSTGEPLSEREAVLLKDILEDLRAGVRPWSESSVGVCRGTGRACEEFLGVDAGVLPPGEYMLRAEVAVPQLGPRGTWSVDLTTRCETTREVAGTTTSMKNERQQSYDVTWAGPSHGYRLSPMLKITSPSPAGTQACTWTMHLGGLEEGNTLAGSWTVPAQVEESP
ncbi:MAG: hypothetical protein ACON5B_07580 [Myxococcota bacterium]